jgi:ferritin
MLISARMNDALNTQIGIEFGASLQYVTTAGYFENESLPEFARRFLLQADEERDHAMRFVRYLARADAKVAVPEIPASRATFVSVEEAVSLALDWELTVTGQINDLVNLAIEENDHLTRNFLQWFVNEQLEEIDSMNTLLGMVRRAGDAGLLFVEDYLARNPLPTGSAAGGTATA